MNRTTRHKNMNNHIFKVNFFHVCDIKNVYSSVIYVWYTYIQISQTTRIFDCVVSKRKLNSCFSFPYIFLTSFTGWNSSHSNKSIIIEIHNDNYCQMFVFFPKKNERTTASNIKTHKSIEHLIQFDTIGFIHCDENQNRI